MDRVFNKEDFAKRLRDTCERLGYSGRRAAADANVDTATFNRTMNGGTPSAETLVRLTAWLQRTDQERRRGGQH